MKTLIISIAEGAALSAAAAGPVCEHVDNAVAMRARELPADCRVEIMAAMLQAMVRNEQAMLAGSPE